MKINMSIVGVLALTLLLVACDTSRIGVPAGLVHGSGIVISAQRPVSGISEVELTTVGTLVIVQNEEERLTLEGEDNIVPLITTEIKGGRLTIATRPGSSFTNNRGLTYTLSVKDLSYLANKASGEVQLSQLKAPGIVFEASGAGHIKIQKLSADNLTAVISASGSLTVSGKVASQKATLSSAGSYDAYDLVSTTAVVTCSGSGNADVNVSGTLEASVSSAGNIHYIGNPDVIATDSGSGSISRWSR